MLSYIFRVLNKFRSVFSRSATWLIFCAVVIGFLGAADMIGVSSFCRFFGLEEKGYHSLLHFFRFSHGWSLCALSLCWESFVISQKKAIMVQGRAVFLGDHTYVPKDGRRMPGVVTLRQNSETQSKPSYFRGHCWGAIGVLIGSVAAPFCLPILMSIHQGHIHIGEADKKKKDRQTLGTRIVQMAIDIAARNNLPAFLVLDAYYPTGIAFKLAASVWSVDLKQPMVSLIIRAKKTSPHIFRRKNPGRKKAGAAIENMEKRSKLWRPLINCICSPKPPAVFTARLKMS